jgi:hypothetical protein
MQTNLCIFSRQSPVIAEGQRLSQEDGLRLNEIGFRQPMVVESYKVRFANLADSPKHASLMQVSQCRILPYCSRVRCRLPWRF